MYSKFPPLWGSSYWWTRIGYILGLFTMAAAILLTVQLGHHLGTCSLTQGLTHAGLAAELAPAWWDAARIVGPCQAANCQQSETRRVCANGQCELVCTDKIQALWKAQQTDRFFIVLYWMFFVYLAVLNIRFGGTGRWRWVAVLCGAAVIPLVSVAAWYDWIENNAIESALASLI